MGTYDSVSVQCPCGREFEFQSKAGGCAMARYTLDDAPPAVKADIIGQAVECACGHSVLIVGNVHAYPRFTWSDDI